MGKKTTKEIITESFLICFAGLIGGILGAWFSGLSENFSINSFYLVMMGFVILVELTIIVLLIWNKFAE